MEKHPRLPPLTNEEFTSWNPPSRESVIETPEDFQRALGVIATNSALRLLETRDPNLEEKKEAWQLYMERSVDNLPKVKPPQFHPSTVRQETVALKQAKRNRHHSVASASILSLETGVYKIDNDPESETYGRSTLRAPDGSASHLKRKNRKRLKKAEKRFRKLNSQLHKH